MSAYDDGLHDANFETEPIEAASSGHGDLRADNCTIVDTSVEEFCCLDL